MININYKNQGIIVSNYKIQNNEMYVLIMSGEEGEDQGWKGEEGEGWRGEGCVEEV